MKTPAHAALSKLAATREGGQSAIARDVGVDPSAVHGWCAATSRPKPHMREMIEALYGIPARDWYTRDELDAIELAQLRAKTSTEAA